MTRTVIRLVTPSASACSCCGQVPADRGQRGGELRAAGRDLRGAGGQQQHGVVGGHRAVDVEPVEADPDRGPQRGVQRRRRRATASVVSTVSMVAIDGAIMPAPLVKPPTAQPAGSACAACLAHGVGGHHRGGRGQPGRGVGGQLARRRCVHPGQHRSRGQLGADQAGGADRDLDRRRTPSSSAACSAVACAVWKPSGPVHALAPPEFSTTARSRAARRAPAGDHSTGAAFTLLRVNTPGGGVVGPVVDDQREVRPAAGLDPGRDPGGPEAAGRGDPAAAHGADLRVSGRPVVSGSPSGQVHALHGASCGALGEVVDRGDHDQPAGVRVDRDLQVHGVGAERGAPCSASRPRAAGARTARRRRPWRRPRGRSAPSPTSAAAEQLARMPRGSGASTGVKLTDDRPTGDRGQVLHDLRGVPVRPADPVGATASPSPRRRAGAA